MAFVQTDTTIQIDLAVTRYRVFREDGMVELWGYVGDYEVCLHLPLDDAKVRPLLDQCQEALRRPTLSGRTTGATDVKRRKGD